MQTKRATTEQDISQKLFWQDLPVWKNKLKLEKKQTRQNNTPTPTQLRTKQQLTPHTMSVPR